MEFVGDHCGSRSCCGNRVVAWRKMAARPPRGQPQVFYPLAYALHDRCPDRSHHVLDAICARLAAATSRHIFAYFDFCVADRGILPPRQSGNHPSQVSDFFRHLLPCRRVLLWLTGPTIMKYGFWASRHRSPGNTTPLRNSSSGSVAHDIKQYKQEYPVYVVAAQGGGIYAAYETRSFWRGCRISAQPSASIYSRSAAYPVGVSVPLFLRLSSMRCRSKLPAPSRVPRCRSISNGAPCSAKRITKPVRRRAMRAAFSRRKTICFRRS